jgi:anti-sigma factor RsiW
MPDTGLTCSELNELVTDYLDGALVAGRRRHFEDHLAGCPACTRRMAEYRRTIRLAGQLSRQRIDQRARASLIAAFREWSLG